MPAPSVTFEVQGLKEVQGRLNRMGEQARISLNEGLREIGRTFVPATGTGPLASETPIRTGKLRRSTVFQIMGGPANQWLEIRQAARSPKGAFYGFFVREGTRPHDIVARNAKALRFEMGGEIIFRFRVHHPGTKPNPYHHRVLNRLRGQVQNIVNRMGQRVAAYLSGR